MSATSIWQWTWYSFPKYQVVPLSGQCLTLSYPSPTNLSNPKASTINLQVTVRWELELGLTFPSIKFDQILDSQGLPVRLAQTLDVWVVQYSGKALAPLSLGDSLKVHIQEGLTHRSNTNETSRSSLTWVKRISMLSEFVVNSVRTVISNEANKREIYVTNSRKTS